MSVFKSVKKAVKKVTNNLGSGAAGAGAGAILGSVVPGIGTALGAVAGGALGVGVGMMADQQAKKQNKAIDHQNAAQQAAIDRANEYSMYTWDLANQYNDPKEQMKRLKAAGLNPNLVYGGGNVTGNTTGVADNAGAASVQGHVVANKFDSAMKTLSLAQGFSNLRNTNTQNELLGYQMGQTAAQTQLINAQMNSIPIQNAYQQAMTNHLGAQDAINNYQLEYARKNNLPVGAVASDTASTIERTTKGVYNLGKQAGQAIFDWFH